MPWTKICNSDIRLLGDAANGVRCASYKEALREAHEFYMDACPDAFIIGQGITEPGGSFGVLDGFVERYGAERILDSPIAENAVTGACIGAACAGKRPILVHMRLDFQLMSMDQIVNHAAKWHYLTNGQVHVPLIIRAIVARGWGSGAQHAQALHGVFLPVPGLRIVLPASPHDVKGLFLQAVNDGNPVLFIEHRWLYNDVGPVPIEPYKVPFGQAVIRRPGTDITIVAVSQMVRESLRAAEALAGEGIDCEVLDPRCAAPLDREAIADSVAKTGRLVVADLGHPHGGLAAEICAVVAETVPQALKAPVRRVTFPDAPIPASPVLEEAYYPDVPHIVAAVRQVMGLGAGR